MSAQMITLMVFLAFLGLLFGIAILTGFWVIGLRKGFLKRLLLNFNEKIWMTVSLGAVFSLIVIGVGLLGSLVVYRGILQGFLKEYLKMGLEDPFLFLKWAFIFIIFNAFFIIFVRMVIKHLYNSSR